MGTARPQLAARDLAVLALGAAVMVFAAFASPDARAGLAVLLVVSVYVAAVAGFLRAPHLAVAGTVVLFALTPTLKVFIGDWFGALKDLVVFGAATAGVLVCVFERRLPDRWVLALVGLLLGLYVINVGGGHGVAWAQGVRLFGEPLVLLLVGLVLPEPRRTLRWALGALVAAACLVAAYGLVQQAVGAWTVVGWGYDFNKQVTTIDDHLRSFGTFDEPFGYAAFLLFGIAATMFWLRRGRLVWAAGGLMLAGLAVSYVRTAVLILAAFIGLWLVRRFRLPGKAVAIAATGLAAVVVIFALALGGASGTQTLKRNVTTSHGTRTESVRFHNGVLNGRASAWKAALGGDPRAWLLGRGVGAVGTAAERAAYTFSPPTAEAAAAKQEACMRGEFKSCPVDSGYLAAVADVGFIGLAVLLALFGRLFALAIAAARQRSDAGWVALGLLVVMMLDALSRSSFTGFPTAFLGLLLVGITLAAVRAESGSLTSTDR